MDSADSPTGTAIPESDVNWQWSRGTSRTGSFTDIPDATNRSYKVVDADRRTGYLRVTATYEDGEDEGKMLEATSLHPVAPLRTDLKSPSFPADFDTSDPGIQGPEAEVGDGTTDEADVGRAISATGESGERLTYSLVISTEHRSRTGTRRHVPDQPGYGPGDGGHWQDNKPGD